MHPYIAQEIVEARQRELRAQAEQERRGLSKSARSEEPRRGREGRRGRLVHRRRMA